MAVPGERLKYGLRSIGPDGGEQATRGERRKGIAHQRCADRPPRLEPQDGPQIDADAEVRCRGHLVQACDKSSLRRVVHRGRTKLGSQQRRLRDRDPGVVESAPCGHHDARVQTGQPVGSLMGQDGSTLDRYESDLQENFSRSDPAGRDEPPVPGESKELADDDWLRDRLSHLRVAADQSGADTRKAVLHAGEDLSDPRLGGSEWKQDDGQEPPWPDAHDRNVVGVHDDRETTDLLRRQGYRVRRSDEHATGDLDGARILPDARSEEDARWWGRKLRQQLAQKGDGKLSGLKRRWRARMDVHGGKGRGSSHEADLHRAIASPWVLGRTDRSALLLVRPNRMVFDRKEPS